MMTHRTAIASHLTRPFRGRGIAVAALGLLLVGSGCSWYGNDSSLIEVVAAVAPVETVRTGEATDVDGDDGAPDDTVLHFVDAASMLGADSCAGRMIVDSVPHGGTITTWWRADCGPVSCIGHIVSGVGLVPSDTGTCSVGDEQVPFDGPYLASSSLGAS